jgi:predicted enzyme related to lactoylglutathione lyase
MEMDAYEHGVPCWVDLGSPDIQKAADFYSALFGWECPEGTEETGFYRVATLKGRPVAGLGPQQNPGPPVWASYVAVDDTDATVAKATENGGTVIVPAMDVMTLGRMAYIADPQGAVIGMWQAMDFPGAGIVNEPGSWGWNELLTTDTEAAKAFYGAVFGWGERTNGEPPMVYTEWQVGGRSVGGMMQKPPMLPAEVPPYWGVYFTVTDTDATVERVASLGGSTMTGPMDIEPGRMAVVADPDGAVFNVIALSGELGQ